MATHLASPGRLALLTALAPLVWGTSYIVSTELLPPDRPLFGAAVRALPADLLAVAIVRQLPRDDWWWRAAVLGTLNIGAFFALLFVAAYRLPGGVGSTLMALTAGAALDLVGLAAGLTAVVSMATGVVLTRRWGRPVGALAFAGWQLTAGGLLLAPLALVVEGRPPVLDAGAVAGYLWLGPVGTLLAYALWFDASRGCPSPQSRSCRCCRRRSRPCWAGW